MVKEKWERIVELAVVGIVLFVGFVSVAYSWIDSVFNVKVNIVLLTVVGILMAVSAVYAIILFDKG